jgi:hypothetical protein
MRLRFTLFLPFFCFFILNTNAQNPVARYGKLKLVGLQLSSECGNPVQLRGISTHGPQWFENCYNANSVASIAKDWKSDIYRIAMYVEEGGYVNDPNKWKTWIDNMVDLAGAQGMYCMIDWHVLADGDPNARITEAKDFWDYMSKKHAGKKHVIYEICNEPNERYKYGANAQEKDVNWPRIKTYAETIIPIIRKNDPETVIIVGTPYWSNRPWRVVGNPLTGSNAYNTMYTYHFYAGTQQHITNFDTVKTILNKIPIFATEWGLSEESGTGTLGLTAAQNFADALAGNNSAGIKVSHCIWSFADKDETSALLKGGSCTNGSWTNRSAAGDKAFSIINLPKRDSSTCYADPKIITQPLNAVVKIGAKATFTVVTAGDKLVYTWQKSTDGTTWTDIQNSNSATFNINAITNNDKAYYRVKVSNYLGYLFSNKVSLILYANGPYFGVPIDIPGKIEAENYDIGGNNVSYYDNSAGNQGGSTYRTDDVDIETTSDSLGGYSIGYWATNEWLDFSVNVLATASYDFSFRTGSANNNTNFQVLLDGSNLISQVNIPNVGNWTAYKTVVVKGINLTKGAHKLRVKALTDGFNLNYIEVKGPKIDCNGELNGNAIIDACGYCAGGNTGVTPKVTGDKCYIVTGSESELELVNAELAIYPNPFHDKLFIRIMQPSKIELFDMNGQRMLEKELSTSSEIVVPESMPSGIYQVKITTAGRVEVKKLIKN